MKAKKFLAMLLAAMMTFSLVACGGTAPAGQEASGNEAEAQQDTETDAAPAADVTIENPSIDFSDGQIGFLGNDKVINPSGDDSVIEAGEFNGESAAQITPQGKNPFIAIQMDALVGDAIGDVASVAVTIGIGSNDGNFYAASGSLYEVIGGAKSGGTTWSIYKEDLNPRTIVHELSGAAAEGDYMVLSMESDVARDNGLEPAGLYILDITFLDADGNTIEADSSAVFSSASTGADRSNLFGIANPITVDLAGSGDGWSQIGYQDLTEEEMEALSTPGSVVEIEYSSETGNMWMGLSGDAWLRVGVGDCDGSGQGYAYYNNSRTIAQITYEDIVSVCGDDSSKWGQIFIESDGAFEVYSVKIGQQAPSYTVTGGIDIGLAGSADGWAQIGYDVVLSDEAIEKLRTPGSIVKVEYSADTDDIWIGLSGEGWNRVGVGDADGSGGPDAISDGSVAFVTYDMIAEICGDDSSKWDTTIFVESDGAFEVYSVTVGMASELLPLRNVVTFDGAAKADGWAQADVIADLMADEVSELLVPGSVISISYTSESGEIWLVFPDSEAGWMRVGVGDTDGSGQGYAAYDGSVCQITFETIEDVLGSSNISRWGGRIQAEASTAWEVYSISIGQCADTTN